MPMRMALRTLLLSVAIGSPVSPSSAADANKVMDALLTCNTAFFETLRANQAAFGVPTVTPHSDPNAASPNPGATRVRGVNAKFPKTVEAYGLHLDGYMQVVLLNSGKPGTYWWGFDVAETPSDVVAAIVGRVVGANFEKKGQSHGWLQELDPVWRNQGGIEHRSPWRMLLVEPSSNGTRLRCGVFRERMGSMTELPDAAELFSDKP